MTTLASFLLFLLVAAYLVNVLKGTGSAWLRAKFLGQPQTTAAAP
jgi:hypothetical protein